MDNRSELIQSASTAIDAQDPELALRLAREILQLDPENADGLLILGISHAMLGNDPDALAALKHAAACAPNSARVRYNLATHLYRVGRKEEAAREVVAALAADPSHQASRKLQSMLEAEAVSQAPDSVSPDTPPIQIHAGNFEGDFSPEQPPKTWIEGIGTLWPFCGWFLTVMDFAIFIIMMILVMPVAMEVGSASLFSEKYMDAVARAMPTWLAVMTWFTRGLWLAWVLADLLTRRRSPWWLLGIIPCCCLNLMWVISAAYLVTGKLEKR